MNIIDRAQATKIAHDNSRKELAAYGRAIHEARTTTPFNMEFAFTGWQIGVVEDDDDWEEGDVFFEVGTPVIRLHYYHKRYEDGKTVIIPLDRMDDLTAAVAMETQEIAERKAKIERKKAERDAKREQYQLQVRRRQYEELKKEFGD